MHINKVRHPFYWIPTTWFAMGLPFVALSTSSAILYKNMGITDAQIAFWTSLIMLPWTIKPLWGPFLEMFKTRKFFVYTTQMISGVFFYFAGLSLQLDHFFSISIAMLALIAFSGSTHDTAADGVYLNELSPKEQAKYVGWQGAFYNIAKVVSGGVLVYLAGELEKKVGIPTAWMIVFMIYGSIMLVMGLYNMKMLPQSTQERTTNNKR